jgi:hypothetical protein
MKRYLNKLRSFDVQLVSGKSFRYQLSSGTPDDNELFIGKTGGVVKGLFVYKLSEGKIYCLSHDDFSYDFLNEENVRLNLAFINFSNSLSSLSSSIVPVIPDEDGV